MNPIRFRIETIKFICVFERVCDTVLFKNLTVLRSFYKPNAFRFPLSGCRYRLLICVRNVSDNVSKTPFDDGGDGNDDDGVLAIRDLSRVRSDIENSIGYAVPERRPTQICAWHYSGEGGKTYFPVGSQCV